FFQLGVLMILEFAFGKEYRRSLMRDKQRSFGTNQHRSLFWVISSFIQRTDFLRRIEFAVEPLQWQNIRSRFAVAGEHPRDVVTLRPGIAPTFGRIFP